MRGKRSDQDEGHRHMDIQPQLKQRLQPQMPTQLRQCRLFAIEQIKHPLDRLPAIIAHGTRFLPHSASLPGVVTGVFYVNPHADQHTMAWDPRTPGRVYLGKLVVRPTPNPSFRRVDATISDTQAVPLLTISTIVGRM